VSSSRGPQSRAEWYGIGRIRVLGRSPHWHCWSLPIGSGLDVSAPATDFVRSAVDDSRFNFHRVDQGPDAAR
jgi:hypothetical protein